MATTKFSVKVGWKHALLEQNIRRQYSTPNASKSDILKACIDLGRNCIDWTIPYNWLSSLKFENSPRDYSTSWQAPITDETVSAIEEIKAKIQTNLSEHGIIIQRLQSQFLLQMLMANLYIHLNEEKLKLHNVKNTTSNLTLPEMAAVFTELLITDSQNEAVLKIQEILLKWKNNNEYI